MVVDIAEENEKDRNRERVELSVRKSSSVPKEMKTNAEKGSSKVKGTIHTATAPLSARLILISARRGWAMGNTHTD